MSILIAKHLYILYESKFIPTIDSKLDGIKCKNILIIWMISLCLMAYRLSKSWDLFDLDFVLVFFCHFMYFLKNAKNFD